MLVAHSYEFDHGALRALASGAGLQASAEALPEGAYSTFRTYGRDRVLRLRQHVARLNESVALQGFAGSLGEALVRDAVAQALGATGYPESRLRLTYAPPRFFVSVEPFVPPPDALYRVGAACVSVPLRRATPHAKDTRFAAQAANAYARLPAGVHEGLMVADDGSILEGLSSNFFALVDGTLYTEEARVLLGITRGVILELAREVVPVVPRAIRVDEIGRASEAFLTSVSRGIMPVVRVDATPVGDGRPGPVTAALRARLEALIEREAETVTGLGR